ncbi:MAG: homoserine kinase [Chloroflexi bacterium]|nr:homoserine kinase [Chloroflexota bacterium]
MPPTRVTVRVPATSANLGPGFDTLGVALNVTGEVTVTWSDRAGRFPESRAEQLALSAARSVYEHVGKPAPAGLHVQYRGTIPVGRGLGASAVLRVGAVVGANELLGRPLVSERLLLLASEMEGHADNAAPALLGGLQVVVWGEQGIVHVQVPFPPHLRAVLFVPDLDMPTSESRKLLPAGLSRKESVHNIGRAALLVAGMATGRLDVLDIATQDVLHQPARSRLFPEMFDIFRAAREAGALCAYLSGGGSSILAFAVENMEQIGEAMRRRAEASGRTGTVVITELSNAGATVISAE